ncbi:uncharacterized protein LOC117307120 [Asterias rubens]|uniref:uncharacterized protein LOC117307120 n=1 Tax=Asterias rubens TaxID=7604 RepID=UPI00145569C5|nr:uncharacterized protein LOC117307120 [Asterias rubens]XP_033647672.1 uncharacterized protein LOC117307120 [Asterias rubens]
MAKPSQTQLLRRVNFLVATGFLLVLGIVYIGMTHVDISVPNTSRVGDRLAFALRWLILSLVPLVSCVLLVARTRGANIETAGYDPTLAVSQKIVEAKQRVLQNTLEQTLIHAMVVLVISSYQEGQSLKIVPILVFVFLCGRVMFSIGYLATDNRINRALGFAMTFLPNILGTFYCVYCLYTRGPGAGIPSE